MRLRTWSPFLSSKSLQRMFISGVMSATSSKYSPEDPNCVILYDRKEVAREVAQVSIRVVATTAILIESGQSQV